ncbi:MAG: hypothetical protein IJA56_01060 [Clostridia bacterium]|nr:hypothetical protein [Clostridia bacterium]
MRVRILLSLPTSISRKTGAFSFSIFGRAGFEPSHASARINSAYFSGQPINEADFTEGLALWRQQGGFVCRYIDTMLAAGKNNHLSIIIE